MLGVFVGSVLFVFLSGLVCGLLFCGGQCILCLLPSFVASGQNEQEWIAQPFAGDYVLIGLL